MAADDPIELRVRSISHEAEGIFSFDLRAPDGRALPSFTPGAHLDVLLPEGMSRSYSLVDLPDGARRYRIGVGRHPSSRGGSAYMCERLRPGDSITVRPPRNHFPLAEDAAHSVFVAGGIGITPIWCMIQRLAQIGRPWHLFYGARTRARAAFLPDILALAAASGGHVTTAFDAEPGAVPLDIAAVLGGDWPPGTHYYGCGPAGMLQAFAAASAGLPEAAVHSEVFAAGQAPARGGFDVVLARSNRTLAVRASQTILDVLVAAGLALPHSCKEGVCGTCETAVLDGTPDHRDAVLSPRERRANDRMMICVSGCLGERLVLDL